jgi:hypothetical protein
LQIKNLLLVEIIKKLYTQKSRVLNVNLFLIQSLSFFKNETPKIAIYLFQQQQQKNMFKLHILQSIASKIIFDTKTER